MHKAVGIRHIIQEHGSEFAEIGVSETDIPRVIVSALERGEVVGAQGDRPVYRTTINGHSYGIAITVNNNGYIVGANSRGRIK